MAPWWEPEGRPPMLTATVSVTGGGIGPPPGGDTDNQDRPEVTTAVKEKGIVPPLLTWKV